jgi:hypothetical protein
MRTRLAVSVDCVRLYTPTARTRSPASSAPTGTLTVLDMITVEAVSVTYIFWLRWYELCLLSRRATCSVRPLLCTLRTLPTTLLWARRLQSLIHRAIHVRDTLWQEDGT